MGTIAGAAVLKQIVQEVSMDANGKYRLYVDESDVNKLARRTPTITIDSDGAIEYQRLIKPSTPTIM